MHAPIAAEAPVSEEEQILADAITSAMEDWQKLVDVEHKLQFQPPRRIEQLGALTAYKDDLEQNLAGFARRATITVAALKKYCQAELQARQRAARGVRVEQRRIAEEVGRPERLRQALEVDRVELEKVERQRSALQRRIQHNANELAALSDKGAA